MNLSFRLIVDGSGSAELEDTFTRYWPSYQRWMGRSRPGELSDCVGQLTRHMPELLPTFEHLHSRLGGTEDIGRFLTLYNPPRVVRACTQVMLDTDSGPVLLRSYDHHPGLVDGLVLRSQWHRAPTLVMTDCIWGALDGINGDGLAIALAFGGRNTIGDGFAAPLICRYVLETCSTVTEARSTLGRLPVYMPYTFAVLDATGDFVTAFLGPDAEATFVKRRCSANHQGKIEWPDYARFVETAKRLDLIELLVDPPASIEHARRVFLSPPVWRTHYANASGTLYVAEYSPRAKSLALHWPGRTERCAMSEACDRRFVPAILEGMVS